MSRKMYRHTRRPADRVIHVESHALKMLERCRVRLVAVTAVFVLVFGILALRLIEVSLVGGGELPFKRLVSEPELIMRSDVLESDASPMQTSFNQIQRHEVVDRNGVVLATNIESSSLVANPSIIKHPEEVARRLSRVLKGDSYAQLKEKLSKPDSKFVYLRRNILPSEKKAVNDLGVPGLFFEHNYRRTYPFGPLTAHVLGYVNIDNHGLAGIEKAFNRRLMDPYNIGEPLALSLDIRLQSILREEMRKAMKEFRAIGASGIIYDIKSAELLALSNLPEFDPHHPASASEEALFNRASLGVYEMGSSFKTFTVANALERGVVSLHDGYDASRPIKVAGFKINDSHPYYRWLSVPEIYAYSSNIGTVKMAMDTGKQAQKTFLDRLGLFEPVDIELPERASPLIPSEWRDISMMTISYGHGMSVSPLHLVRAMASMINGGMDAPMTLIKDKYTDEHEERQRVMSEQTSRHVRKLMRHVVQYGTARKANVAGNRVGGKTGTAEKIVDGRYEEDAKIASFISAFPMDDPRYLVFVMLDEPKGTKATYGYATGGWIAAPVVHEVIARMGPLLGIQPVFDGPDPSQEQFWAESERRNREARRRVINKGLVHAATF